MARIGDYIDAGLNRYDPGDFMRGSALAAASVQQSLQQGVGAITDAMDKRKEYKDQLKTGKDLAKAMKVIYPEIGDKFDPFIAQLDDEETPLSQRAALGNEAATLINAYIRKGEGDRAYNLDLAESNRADRGMALDEQTTAANLAKAEREGRVFESNWQSGQAEKAAEEEINAQVSPYLVEQSVKIAQAMEGQGQQAPISSNSLLSILREGTPQEKRRAAEMFTSLLPKEEIPKFQETPVTINGQPGKASTVWNPRTRTLDVVPVRDAYGDGSGGQYLPEEVASDPIKGEIAAAASRYGIPAGHALSIVAQESDFNPGTTMGSSSAKGLFQFLDADRKQYGVSANSPLPQQIDAGMRKMKDNYDAAKAALGREPTPGELYATYYQGIGAGPAILANPNGSFRDTLNKFGEGHASRVISANPWLKGISTNREFVDWSERKMQSKGFTGQGGIQAGATTAKPAAPQTPAQIRKDELEMQKLEAEAAAGTAAAKKADTKAARVLGVIDKYTYRDAKTGERKANGRLDDAVGFGAGIGSYWNRAFDDRTAADQQELTRNLIESSLLEAAKDLKPVSEDEMKMLMERRPKITDGPAVWAQFMTEAEQILREGMSAEAKNAPPPSAADRLRAMIPAK